MSMLEIPIASSEPYFSQENHIFGKSYNFTFEWIERENFWALHLYDEVERPVALGIRLIANWPLFRHREVSTTFFLIPKTPNIEPKLETLQSDFMLVASDAL